VLCHVLVKGVAGDNLDQVSSQRHAEIGVADLIARWHDLGRHLRGKVLAQRLQIIRATRTGTGQFLIESAGMGEKMGDRNRISGIVIDLEFGEVLVDRSVQIDQSLLGQLHDGRRHEQLGDGAGPEKGLCSIDRSTLLDFCLTITLGQQDFAILNEDDNSAGAMRQLDLLSEKRIEEGFQFGWIVGASGLGVAN